VADNKSYDTVTLPNGDTAKFPTGTPKSVMRAAIYKHWPEYDPANKEKSFGEALLRYGVQDPVAGLAQFGHSLINLPHDAVSLISDNLAKHIPVQAPQNFAKQLGRKGGENTIDSIVSGATEIAPSFLLPEAKLGKIGEAIEAVPKVGRFARSAVAKGLPQALYAGATTPESRGDATLAAGATTVPFSAASYLALSDSPTSKLASKLISTGLGAGLGYGASQAAGAHGAVATGASLLGALLGMHGLSARKNAQDLMYEGVLDKTGNLMPEVEERLQAADRDWETAP